MSRTRASIVTSRRESFVSLKELDWSASCKTEAGGRYKLTNMLSVLATGLSEPFPLPSGDSKPESIDDSEPLELRPRAASGSSIGDV